MEVSIRRVAAATRIQAAFRGRLVRRELIDAVRVDFEEVMRRVEGPLRSLDLNAPTPSKPWGELGWKSPRRLSPPSVLDLDMEISPDSDAGNDAADRAPRIDERDDDDDDASARVASRVAAAIEGVRLVRGREDEGESAADDVRAREMRLSTLRQELAWAKAALDDRRQHLRRLRWQQSQRW